MRFAIVEGKGQDALLVFIPNNHLEWLNPRVILEYDPTMDAEEYPPKAVIWVPDQFIISVNLEMVSSRPQTITHMLPPATPCREPHRRHEDHRHEDHRRHE
ncbi:hypothetical protein Hamer_G031455 [Homarus americanus]|uniref:Uncharacterized protein n=2 Tax=Homarus americanus TaxID=6706 RepID=A0A8J5N7H1_HOMAM|nr:hypothetical protein Hamer_G031455 [Homarus americanus]